MTRLNTDNLTAFLSVETPAADSPALRTEPEAKPFDAFLQRAGRSPDTGAQDAPQASQSGPPPSEESDPIDAHSNSARQDAEYTTEPDGRPEENRDTSESTADAGNATPEGDRPEATDTPSDDETDGRVDAASEERSDDNTEGERQAEVAVDVTEIAAAGGGQETSDDADSAAEETRSRESPEGMKNRHEDRRSESGQSEQMDQAPVEPEASTEEEKPTDLRRQGAATSGQPEQMDQAPVEPEAPTEEEKPIDLRRQGEERKPAGPAEGTPEPSAGGHAVVTEPEDKPEEEASAQSRIDNPLGAAVSPQGQRTPSEETRRRTGRQGSTRAAPEDKGIPASQTVAKTPAGQDMITGQEQVAADEVRAAPEETKSETQERIVKPTSTADVKATSAAPPKGWSPEGLRSTTAPPTPDGAQTDQVERVRFVQRVARAFDALGDGNGPVRLRLRPPELGGLRLEVSIRNGMMTAHIETETAAARTLLLDNLPALRERLAQQDIKVDSFDVDLADRSPDGSPQRPDDDRQTRDRTDENDARDPENQDGDTADDGSAGAVTRTGEGTRLDVVI